MKRYLFRPQARPRGPRDKSCNEAHIHKVAEAKHKDEDRMEHNEEHEHNEGPEPGEYIGVIVKEALSTLSTVANILPVPGLGPAVKLAINIIQAYDDGCATFDRADELRLRMKSLVDVLLDRLNGKTLDDIDDGLKKSIEMLHKDMEYIQMTLDSIASKGTFKFVMFRSLHEEKVRKCITKLDNAIVQFHMIRQVEHTIALAQLQHGVTALQDASERT
ncbi:hypothetical protein H0H92_012195 [Tricholoma furcatifolium]|nr:hypothetical protein H0H92_012195 [Tricholoma furcatifolium]